MRRNHFLLSEAFVDEEAKNGENDNDDDNNDHNENSIVYQHEQLLRKIPEGAVGARQPVESTKVGQSSVYSMQSLSPNPISNIRRRFHTNTLQGNGVTLHHLGKNNLVEVKDIRHANSALSGGGARNEKREKSIQNINRLAISEGRIADDGHGAGKSVAIHGEGAGGVSSNTTIGVISSIDRTVLQRGTTHERMGPWIYLNVTPTATLEEEQIWSPYILALISKAWGNSLSSYL